MPPLNELLMAGHLGIAHTTGFVTPVVEDLVKCEIAQWGDRPNHPSYHKRTLYHGSTSSSFLWYKLVVSNPIPHSPFPRPEILTWVEVFGLVVCMAEPSVDMDVPAQ